MIYKCSNCDASSRINDEITQRIELFNMNGLKRFEPAYLSALFALAFISFVQQNILRM